jgi:hypothetical protein
MDFSAHTRNDKISVMTSVTLFSRRATMCVNTQGGHFEQLLHKHKDYLKNFVIIYRNVKNVI